MKFKLFFPLLLVVSCQLSAATTNLDVAKLYISNTLIPLTYKDGDYRIINIGPGSILSSVLSEKADGKVDAIIDFLLGYQSFRYQEENLFYNYVADFNAETASFGLTKSGMTLSSPFERLNIQKNGTELLELNLNTGVFSPSGIYVLNLIENTCLSVCEDPYPHLTAQAPLPSAAFLFISSLFGLSFFTRPKKIHAKGLL